MIGIIGALQAEVESLIRAIEDLRWESVGGYRFALGKIGSHEVAVVRCDVGKVNAAVCCQTMILTYRPEVVINTGVAGSLSPRLDILDVAVATDAVQHDFDCDDYGYPKGAVQVNDTWMTYLPCDEYWRGRLLAAAKFVGVKALPARIATGDQFITRREVKRRIVNEFSAEACEMEGAAIAQTCALSGVPCAILRAISDATDDNHSMEFKTFLEKAVENSTRIMLEVLK